ncbi:MAG: hypothetical protein K9N21_09980 [Deltaproteobacteria bacterium]|nr:hypothetical protein [Deltaproteobacteria bacterium]
MKKIVVVSREPENHKQLIALIRTVFPECWVQIIKETGDGLSSMHVTVGNETDSCVRRTVALGD